MIFITNSMKKFFLTILILTTGLCSFAQNEKSAEETFLDAEYYRLYEEYEEALPLYQQLINDGYDNAHINYRIGECLLEIPGKKDNSLSYLKKAVKNINRKFKEGSFKEKGAPVYAIFYLGKAYQVNDELDKALETYETFKNKLGEKRDEYNMDFVNKQIESCKTAQELMENPINIKQENLGQIINNPYANIKPVVNNDESKIVFTSKLKFYDAVFMAEKKDGQWGPPKNLTPQIKSEGNLYNTSLDKDGNKMLLFKANPYNGDIYMSKMEENKWNEPQKLNKNINSRFWETHACFCQDENKIYFTSNRRGGLGGLDIYVSSYDHENKEWGKPKNLGAQINTPYNEETPFLSNDGKRIYFSSQGHKGMGGFDIFYSDKVDGKWTKPVNIGYPINTTDDDLFFCPVDNGNAGYMAKYTKDGYGQKDIVRIEIFSKENPRNISLQGSINLDDPKKKISNPRKIKVILDSLKGDTINVFHPDSNMEYQTNILPGNYKITFRSENFKTLKKEINIGWDYPHSKYQLNALLIPKKEPVHFITIRNIFFDFDKASLKPKEKEKIDTVVNLMKQHPQLTVEIIGHTDSKGSKKYNQKLSEKRSEAVAEYLKNKSISKKRITTKGKGEKYPIALNVYNNGKDCPKGRKYNRRAEIKPITKEKNYIVNKKVNIPNELIKRGAVTYSILIKESNKKINQDQFNKYKILKKYNIREYHNGKYFYVLGEFSSQAEAIDIYKKIINAKFFETRIVSNYQLEDLLELNQK